jgi:hypothetical protein
MEDLSQDLNLPCNLPTLLRQLSYEASLGHINNDTKIELKMRLSQDQEVKLQDNPGAEIVVELNRPELAQLFRLLNLCARQGVISSRAHIDIRNMIASRDQDIVSQGGSPGFVQSSLVSCRLYPAGPARS